VLIRQNQAYSQTLCLHISIANKTPESATSCKIAPAACLVAYARGRQV